MTDAPYTPSLDELLTGDKEIGDHRWRGLTEDEIRRGIAAHVASEVERLADDPTLRLSGHSGISITRLRARAAEIREGKTDGQ